MSDIVALCLFSLERLELIRFYIGSGMEKALQSLQLLRKVSVWPEGGNQVKIKFMKDPLVSVGS